MLHAANKFEAKRDLSYDKVQLQVIPLIELEPRKRPRPRCRRSHLHARHADAQLQLAPYVLVFCEKPSCTRSDPVVPVAGTASRTSALLITAARQTGVEAAGHRSGPEFGTTARCGRACWPSAGGGTPASSKGAPPCARPGLRIVRQETKPLNQPRTADLSVQVGISSDKATSPGP